MTLTSGTLDVKRIFRHLTEEMGFQEIGFAPATTAPKHDYSITDEGFDTLLGQFRELAEEFLEAAVENRHHAFSNVKETLGEIHKGMSKAYPCGAGLGLMGVATDGDVALCHRFAGSDAHKLGTVADGIDRRRSARFSRSITSTRRPTAASAGRGRSARAAVITRHTRATATRRRRTCITASGFAAGPTSVCASTAELSSATRRFSRSSITTRWPPRSGRPEGDHR